MNKQNFFKVLHVLKYLLGPATLALVIWFSWHKKTPDGEEVGICSIFERDFAFQWGPLLLATILCAASTTLTFLRWYVLVRAQDLPFTVGNAIQLGLLGTFFSTFLPGSVSGDIPKMIFMARDQRRRTVAVATIMIDRVVGLCGLIWLAALLGGIFWYTGALESMVRTAQGIQTLEYIVRITWILAGGSIAFWLVLGVLSPSVSSLWISRIEKIPKLGHPLAELCRATLMYRSRGRAMALAMFMAMIGHVGFVVTFYLCSLAVNLPDYVPSCYAHFLVVPVGATVQSVGITPGGMGVGELAFGWLYDKVGGVFAEGVLATIMRRVIDLFLGTLGFAVYWRMKPTMNRAAVVQDSLMTGEAGLGISSRSGFTWTDRAAR